MTLGELIRSLEILETTYGHGCLDKAGLADMWFRGGKPKDGSVLLKDCGYRKQDMPAHMREELSRMGWVFLTPPRAEGFGLWMMTARQPGHS